jgi:hypothetical protein
MAGTAFLFAYLTVFIGRLSVKLFGNRPFYELEDRRNLSRECLTTRSANQLTKPDELTCRYTVDAIPRTAADFGTDQRCWCVRGKQAVSSTATPGRRQGRHANCSPTIYRKPISRRKAVGVTPISFRNTRFSWGASLNPAASATSSIDRSLFNSISFATLIRSDRMY